ncbi:hypothetical protein SKAU_G00106810 [Synaphobranchus kaupii]|uniref:Uncharacterized protein n=1 Tax=Synaphobranchus kaupii TaxID=118154 RepID=A0A9Q1J805_SYNKA|nr:hypothetical protein SKAU_G00106810 [Synaphobranchus kaupii]
MIWDPPQGSRWEARGEQTVSPSMHQGSTCESAARHSQDDIIRKAVPGGSWGSSVGSRLWTPAVMLLMACPLSGSNPTCHFPARKKLDPGGGGFRTPIHFSPPEHESEGLTETSLQSQAHGEDAD